MDTFEKELVRLQDRLRGFAYGFARVSKGVLDGDDLLQETNLRALRFRSQFNHEAAGSELTKWLYVIMRSVFYVRMRHTGRLVYGEEFDLYLLSPEAAIDGGQEAAVELFETLACLDKLTIRHGRRTQLIRLAAIGMSYEEMAKHTGVAKNTVKSRISRGRAQLKELMEQT